MRDKCRRCSYSKTPTYENDTGNSVAGTLHRAWIDVKSLFGGDDRESILSLTDNKGQNKMQKFSRVKIS
ncbi:DUF2383 domain-containing protein [Pedobacter psychroterrae]|uniref:DUF2383 domain-containing protein n=1 Tax=Pedobacter psychroterrae TaxID=2530453 RepID=A0A4R0NSI4_9SPHI|nr:DUF2383 domain-containing protein [Pedobacter psychroterrae]TCD02863.1 DUF2383 domain-containing protein [Pedobacter psychroterrae]